MENQNNYIYGKNPVLEAITKNPKRINKIFIQNNIGFDNRIKKIIELAKEFSLQVQFTNLNNKTAKGGGFEHGINHQGVMALVSPVEFVEYEEFIANLSASRIAPEQLRCTSPSNGYGPCSSQVPPHTASAFKKIVILDGVSDPHNFGAIIRTCACAGFDGIIVSNHRACPITSTVEKTSAGAVNYIPIVKVNSLSSTIDDLKKSNWWIIATEVEAKDNYFNVDFNDMDFAIILGAEGKGVTKTLLNKADFKVSIPTKFESLNVSTACAVIVYEAVRQLETASRNNKENLK